MEWGRASTHSVVPVVGETREPVTMAGKGLALGLGVLFKQRQSG
ncbi:MAG TPA: PEP-CTERM sorting domain-containing protein [Geminocystis sp. M7585_C2015_104]|nr:PEP-CTERM sorting domain-containing protein [Geminocystis sp. M7585_C2015_104]